MSAAAPVFAGPLGQQLRVRLERAVAEAQQLLGLPLDPSAVTDVEALHALIAAVANRLPDSRDRAELLAAHGAALERLRVRFADRVQALERVAAAISQLREITSPPEMLSRAPAALCRSSAFERAILSLVGDGRMLAESAYFQDDDPGAHVVLAALRANPVPLEHPLIDAELLRRRRATIVGEVPVHPRVHRPTAELLGWTAYAAAPIVVGGQVLGVLHADRRPSGTLDVLDRDVMWEFATGLAQAYESASLRRALRQEREQMRQFLEWVNARSGELSAAPVALKPSTPSTPLPAQPVETIGAGEGRDDRLVFEGLLTRRELDVLRLLADGRTNRAIAAELVLSTGTVRFHVNSILRKLRVANRAEAVSRYLGLLGMRGP
jgi:LuxR family transcriptional regulator, regulator of acetate metabolism